MFSTILSIVLSKMLFLALHLESRTLPKPLTERQEKEEFEKYKNGDMSARDRIIEHNLRLVAHIAKKYYNNAQDNDDIMSVGTIGLIKAVQSFSYDKNTRFSTFASRCIENEILMSFRKQRGTESTVYLEDNLELNNDASKLTLKDSLQDDFDLQEYCENEDSKQRLLSFIATSLDGRERQIIVLRYGIGGNEPLTQQKVCEILGISRSYVSRLETRALAILREKMQE